MKKKRKMSKAKKQPGKRSIINAVNGRSRRKGRLTADNIDYEFELAKADFLQHRAKAIFAC